MPFYHLSTKGKTNKPSLVVLAETDSLERRSGAWKQGSRYTSVAFEFVSDCLFACDTVSSNMQLRDARRQCTYLGLGAFYYCSLFIFIMFVCLFSFFRVFLSLILGFLSACLLLFYFDHYFCWGCSDMIYFYQYMFSTSFYWDLLWTSIPLLRTSYTTTY